MYISILFLQPICIIGLLLINLIMMKAKERETNTGIIIQSDYAIHFMIGFMLSYFMIYFLAGFFYQLFQ